jgi:hypothetical protein
MSEERSPCLQCERLSMDKVECSGWCEKLENFMERLPYSLLSGEDLTEYGIPGDRPAGLTSRWLWPRRATR